MKHTRDVNQLAHSIVAKLTGTEKPKNPAAVALGRLGGLKGGHARMAGMNKKQRAALGRKAAKARWSRPRKAK